jgi:hypothetical protein
VKRAIAAGGLIVLALAAGAQAQPAYVGPRAYQPAVPPYEVDAIVRSAGLVPLAPPARRGSAYVLAATDRYGRHVRVVVDAEVGEIISVRPMLAAAPYGAPVHGAPSVVYVPRGDPPPPVPPRSVPSARLAGVPPVASPADPMTTGAIPPAPPSARTPLPRPRPVVAAAEAPAARPTAPEAPVPLPAVSAPTRAETAPQPAPAKPAAPNLVPVAPLDE